MMSSDKAGEPTKSAPAHQEHTHYPSRAVISRKAFLHNLKLARKLAGEAEIMAVVKADAYGHGAVQISKWALEAGVHWLAIAQLGEAIEVRRALTAADCALTPHILALIVSPDSELDEALRLGIDLTVGSAAVLDAIAAASAEVGVAARVHLEVDTGMARGGISAADELAMAEIARSLAGCQNTGLIEVVGVWSHLACADDPESEVTEQQIALFENALEALRAVGINPQYQHLAASAGLLWHPRSRYTMVRPGIMLYGLSPNPEVATAQEIGLEPVMRLEASVVSVRDVASGTAVSYGHTAHTVSATRLATVPLGYADGIPRSASNKVCVGIAGELQPILGRVCMDQFVIEAPRAKVGDVVTLFGGGQAPSADEWAADCGTIGYEIVTRIGMRVPREYAKPLGVVASEENNDGAE